MKKLLLATAALIALPALAQAQSQPMPGFYIGGEGGLNWMFNTTANVPGFGGAVNIYPATGWAAGGMIGYDFVGPRVELEGIYRQQPGDPAGRAHRLPAIHRGRQHQSHGHHGQRACTTSASAGRSCPISAPAPASPSSMRPP